MDGLRAGVERQGLDMDSVLWREPNPRGAQFITAFGPLRHGSEDLFCTGQANDLSIGVCRAEHPWLMSVVSGADGLKAKADPLVDGVDLALGRDEGAAGADVRGNARGLIHLFRHELRFLSGALEGIERWPRVRCARPAPDAKPDIPADQLMETMMVATQTPAFTQPEPLDPEILCALRRARLADFLHLHWCDGIDELTEAIRQAVLAGGGDWIDPSAGSRPASHLVEISLYGASATGCSLDEAVRNWRRVAERLALAAIDEDAA